MKRKSADERDRAIVARDSEKWYVHNFEWIAFIKPKVYSRFTVDVGTANAAARILNRIARAERARGRRGK